MFDPASVTPIEPSLAEWINEFNSEWFAQNFYEITANISSDKSKRWLLEHQLLTSGFHASIWEYEGRKLERGRNSKSAVVRFNKDKNEQILALDLILNALERNGPEQRAAGQAYWRLKERGIGLGTGEKITPVAETISSVFSEYRAALSEVGTIDPRQIRESSYKCFMFPDGRKIATNSATTETALAFDIFCILSRFKAGNSLLRSSNPLQLEEPDYALPSSLALYLLNISTKNGKARALSNKLRAFINSNPAARQCHWPTMRSFTSQNNS